MYHRSTDNRIGGFILAVSLMLGLSAPLQAFHFQAADDIYLSGDFLEDVMLAGSAVNFDGTVTGDLLTASRTLTFDGIIDGNVNAAAQRVTINGEIRRSLRAFAQTVNINSRIDGDVTTFASEVTFASEASIGRDVGLFGNEVFLDGTIGSDAYIYATSVNISGRIEGNVKVKAARISIAPDTYIGGDFSYESKEKAKIAPGAQILGETRWKKRTGDSEGGVGDYVPPPGGIVWSAIFFLGTILTGILLLVIRRDLVLSVVDEIRTNGAAASALGLAIILLMPFVILLTGVTFIGLPVALTGLTIYGFLFLIGKVIAAIAIGSFVLGWLRKGKKISFGWSLVIGTILVAILFKVPILGWVVYLLVWALGAGAIVLRIFRGRTRATSETAVVH